MLCGWSVFCGSVFSFGAGSVVFLHDAQVFFQAKRIIACAATDGFFLCALLAGIGLSIEEPTTRCEGQTDKYRCAE